MTATMKSQRKNQSRSQSESQGLEESTTDERIVEESRGTPFDPVLGTESYVILQRQDTDTQWVYHGKFSVEDFTFERVATLFGGGKYRAFQKKRHENGKFVYHNTVTFNLPGPYRPPTTALPGTDQPNEGVSVHAPVATAVGTFTPGGPMPSRESLLDMGLLQLLNGMQTMMTTAATMAQKAVEARPVDTGNTSTVELLKVMLPLLATRDVPDPVERMKQLTGMVKDLMPAAGPPSPVKEIIQSLNAVLNLKDRLAPETAPAAAGDPTLALGLELVKLLKQNQPNGTVPQPMTTPAPVATAPSQLPPWQQVLLSNRALILQSAGRGVDAEYAASVVATYLPSELTGIVAEFVQLPNAAQLAVNTIPELQNFPQWTEKFFVALKQEMTETEDDAEGPTDGPPQGP